jgi:hypothetical protein
MPVLTGAFSIFPLLRIILKFGGKEDRVLSQKDAKLAGRMEELKHEFFKFQTLQA